MPGRKLLSESEVHPLWANEVSAQRRKVLRETITAFETADPADRYHRFAAANLERWRSLARPVDPPGSAGTVEIHSGDWGDVTGAVTARHGVCFAVLNMANPHVPGGAYVEGAIAQEENLFRRTDCHFRVGAHELDVNSDCYTPAMTRLLTGRDGRVYFDCERARVCIRGPEDRTRADLGYAWLGDRDVFPFYELRAAAQDLRDGSPFDAVEARRRVAAQLDTLRHHGQRYAVLSAFGCGAFRNPAESVAVIYKDEIAARARDFDLIVFAIFAPGYGPDNYAPFAKVFGEPR